MQVHRTLQQKYSIPVTQVWFAIFFGSLAIVAPFLNLFLARQGYSSSQIGLLAAARPWAGAIAGTLGCSIADKFRVHRYNLLPIALLASSTRSATGASRSHPTSGQQHVECR